MAVVVRRPKGRPFVSVKVVKLSEREETCSSREVQGLFLSSFSKNRIFLFFSFLLLFFFQRTRSFLATFFEQAKKVALLNKSPEKALGKADKKQTDTVNAGNAVRAVLNRALGMVFLGYCFLVALSLRPFPRRAFLTQSGTLRVREEVFSFFGEKGKYPFLCSFKKTKLLFVSFFGQAKKVVKKDFACF